MELKLQRSNPTLLSEMGKWRFKEWKGDAQVIQQSYDWIRDGTQYTLLLAKLYTVVTKLSFLENIKKNEYCLCFFIAFL